MANRHLSRSIVMQSLFELDFSGGDFSKLPDVLKRNIEEFAPGTGDSSFMENLGNSVIEKKGTIDDIIEKAAPDWPIDKIAIVDRNILRIGLYELLYSDHGEVPPKVAINEAIELAKTFGGDNSGRFINGVLGAVYKEMGEPGKDDGSRRRKNNTDPSTWPVERLVGAVVFARDGEDVYLAMVHDIFGHWTLSKGHLLEKEDEKEGTKRKVKDEIGIDVEVREKLGGNEYVASDPEKGKIRKQVNYFLAEGKFEDLTLGDAGGLDDTKWFKLADIITLNIYDDILPIITKGINILLKK